jgi:hypothetical protein
MSLPTYDERTLDEELSQRVEEGPFLRDVVLEPEDPSLVVAGIDGSSVGGILAIDGTGGDFAFGSSPQVSINTASGILNKNIRVGTAIAPVFMRLPERPEDAQRGANRYSIMAKLFFPDLTDSQYVHSTWNAMDLMESRATNIVLGRWTMAESGVEVAPADVVFRDGTVVPNDRDQSHYGEQSSYGRIVRALIEESWKIAQSCKDNAQTVAGTVKNAQLRVLSPVVNYFVCEIAREGKSQQIPAWDLAAMNHLDDQALMSRIMTAGRTQDSPWQRTSLTLRPFHATSPSLGRPYSRVPEESPAMLLIKRSKRAQEIPQHELTPEEAWWAQLRHEGDPYLQMLNHVWYAGFFVASTAALDRGTSLPRYEFVLPHPVREEGNFPADPASQHLSRMLRALALVRLNVAKDHSMFTSDGRIDLLPTILIRTHEIAKSLAWELKARVIEFMDHHLGKYMSSAQRRQVRFRPYSRKELKAWVESMNNERRLGGPQ